MPCSGAGGAAFGRANLLGVLDRVLNLLGKDLALVLRLLLAGQLVGRGSALLLARAAQERQTLYLGGEEIASFPDMQRAACLARMQSLMECTGRRVRACALRDTQRVNIMMIPITRDFPDI